MGKISSIRKGKSVDNGFYKRKNLKIIHYDQMPLADGIFAEAVSSNGKDPVDEPAIFRVDLERFFYRLTPNETLYIRYKTMDGTLSLTRVGPGHMGTCAPEDSAVIYIDLTNVWTFGPASKIDLLTGEISPFTNPRTSMSEPHWR